MKYRQGTTPQVRVISMKNTGGMSSRITKRMMGYLEWQLDGIKIQKLGFE